MTIRYYTNRGSIWMDYKNAEGTRRRIPTGYSNEAEARKNTVAILARDLIKLVTPAPVQLPTVVIGGRTIQDAFDRGMKERNQWIDSTDKRTIEGTFKNLGIGPMTPVASLTRDYVRDLRGEWLVEPGKRIGSTLSNSTINHRLSMLTCLLEIEDLPPHNVKHLSTKGNNRMRRITPVEIRKGQAWLCAHGHLSEALTLCALITVALETGARQDEWLSRPWSDITDDTVTFRKTKNRLTRTINLNPTALAVLQARRSLPGGPFRTLTGDRVTKLWDQMREGLGLAEEQDFVFHGLRHEAINMMVDDNVNAFVIQAVAGHANISTTQGYAKASQTAIRAAMNRNHCQLPTAVK